MAKIPLRSYIQEIEGLIDRGQTEEAIAHCKHILRYYPKHIDTYRMLEKAYLESQRYSEAADVLHRVLSVYPDDFVSQIGMSIIREDEGNLDAAIWHMEKTFEVQPANTAVQDELRRLYGRRDGVEPPKVRLTRGALARLYARGELYPQAIAEVRAALAEDPERVDLEVVLAQNYYAVGQKVEATEVCSRLVNKLPFCYEANRLLAEILPGTSRTEDAKTYRQRIFALDPYAAYISQSALTAAQVPDNAVTVDHLDWQAPQENAQQQPDWAKTVGIDLGETEEKLPDWLTPMPIPPSSQTEQSVAGEPSPADIVGTLDSTENKEPVAAESPSENEVIPDWMKSAGWAAANESETEPTPLSEDNFAEEIAPAEIPDWLQSFAPAENELAAQETQNPEEQEKLEVSDKILPSQPPDTAIESLPPEITTEKNQQETLQEATIPVHVQPKLTNELQKQEAEPSTEETLPDWLQGLGLEEKIADTEKGESQAIPDWLKSISQSDNEQKEQASGDLPSWLSTASAEQNGPSHKEETSAETPDWLKPAGREEPVQEPPQLPTNQPVEEEPQAGSVEINQEPEKTEPISAGSDVDAAMAWLESLAAKQGADQGTLTIDPTDRIETPPEWVQREMEGNAPGLPEAAEQAQPEQKIEEVVSPAPSAGPEQAIASEPAAAEAETISAPEAEVFPQTEYQEKPATGEIEEASKPVNMAEETAQVPLSEPAEHVENAVNETSLPAPEANIVEEEKPAAILETPPDVAAVPIEEAATVNESLQLETSTPPESQQPTVAAESASPAQPDLSADDGFAWLEALAAKQGADESTLLMAPQDRAENPPDWVSQVNTAPLEEISSSDHEDEPKTEPIVEKELEPVSEKTETPEIGLPDWLRSEEFLEQEGEEEATVQPNQAAQSSLPDWLKEIEAEEEPQAQTFETPIEQANTPTVPDWPSESKPEIETAGATENLPIPEEKEKLPEWLESIKNEPIKEETQVSLENQRLDKQQEPLPAWLQGLDETASQAPALTENISKAEEVPSWVNELDRLSVEENKPGATRPLALSPEGQLIEPQDGIEMPAEVAKEPEIVQPEATVLLQKENPPEEQTQPISGTDESSKLLQAQSDLNKGKLKEALEVYNQLISSGKLLDESIHDLRDALYRYPIDIGLWQALGDAYLRGNHVQDALDAYTKAEELLR